MIKNTTFFKVLSLVFSFFLATQTVQANVSSYTFTQTSGTYAAITGTTLYSGTWDDASSASLTIPYTFTYNGVAYTSLAVNTNGFLTLGAVPATTYCGLQTSAMNSIAGYGTDLVNGNTTSSIQYAVTGTTPNRKFVVQWTDCKHYGATGDLYSFQIILNETSNIIQTAYNAFTCATTMGANSCTDAATESGNVGLLGASTADFNIRSITNGTNTWLTSVNGGALNAVCNLSSSNFPANGLTFSWTPPVPTPMVFNSCTAAIYNNGEANGQGAVNARVYQVQVVTTGSLSPLSVSSLTLNTTGCTNAAGDISSAKVYFTGTSGTFSTANQFGATQNNPNGSYTLTGSATLGEGINYFWVTYNLTNTATIGNVLKGCCTQVVGTGSIGTQIPTVTCPTGSHTVAAPIGFWTPVSTLAPSGSGGVMLLLSDGTLICKSGSGATYGNLWNKLTPNAAGSYVNGTWSTLPAMINDRLYFSSQILKDGRVYVAGGEYGTGLQQAEVYDPIANTWTACPSPGQNISDANSEILEDGRILQALVAGNLKITTIYNPATNTYATGPSSLGIHNESAWVKLKDNSVLMVDRLSTNSERYIPATNTWVADATVPVALYDPYGDETGGAILLPDGRAFFIGSLGHTAYYTPSNSTSPGTWAAGPDIPNGLGVPDGAAAMMANGKIIMVASPTPTSANHFPPPTYFFEFDYVTNSYTAITTPQGAASTNMSCYLTNFVCLPDGTIMYCNQGSSSYYVYTPGSAQLASGKPTVASVIQTDCNTFKLTGTKFNGISQGGTYGDDWQMATNYPIVRLVNGSNVYYCRTFNWNSTGVQRTAPDTVQFTLPAGLPVATYQLIVSANGISSDPVTFIPKPYISSSLTATACSGNLFTYTPTLAPVTASMTWTRAAVSGISNAAVSTAQSGNPSETLINTTAAAVNVTYQITLTSNGCTNTQAVTVTVNPSPTVTANSTATAVCAGQSVTLSGSGASTYVWTGGVSNGVAFVPANTTTYTVTGTNANGCTATATKTITVNALPVVTATASSNAVCTGASVTLNGGGANTYVWTGGVSNGVAFVPAATTTYTVTGTSALGCTNTATKLITVNALPVVTANATAAAVCAGQSVTLTGGGANTYVWTGGVSNALAFTPASTATYTVTGTDGNSCSNTATKTITVNTVPTVTANASANSVCAGQSVTLSGAGANSYTWSGGISNAIAFIPSSTTTYTVTGTNANGCTATATKTITVNALPTLSINATATNVCSGQSVTLTASGANSYSWTGGVSNGVSFVPAATTTYVVTGSTSAGCTSSSSVLITVSNCAATVDVKFFVEGYSVSTTAMQPVLYNSAVETNPLSPNCDTVTVELRQTVAPYAVMYTTKVLLKTTGHALCTFNGVTMGTSYYISLKHRSGLNTWSANPVVMSANVSYDFTTAANKAYGANQTLIFPGVYAIYNGDLNQDENIDAFDYLLLEPAIVNGYAGYLNADLNGDGVVDAFDYITIEPNIVNGITTMHP